VGAFEEMLRQQQMMQADDQNAENAGWAVPSPGMGVTPGPMLALNKQLPPELMKAATGAVKTKINQYQKNLTSPAMTPPASAGSGGSATRNPDQLKAPEPTGNLLGEDVDARELMRAIAEQDEGIKAQQALADKFRNRPQQVDYSPLMGLMDSFYGGKLSASYNKPLTADERDAAQSKLDDASNSQRQKKTGDLVNLQKSKNSADTSYARGLMSMIAATNATNQKGGANEEKELDKLEKEFSAEVSPTRGKTGEYGKMYGYRNRADRAAAIIANMPSGNLTNYQKSELAGAVASLVTNGNQTAVETIRRFDPTTAEMSYDQLVQWLSGKPQVLKSAAFVETFRDLLARERDIANENLQTSYEQRAARFYKLKAKRPDIYAALDEKGRAELKSPKSAALPTKEEMKAAQDKEAAEKAPPAKEKREYSPSRKQTRITYPDGRVEMVDGDQR